MPVKPVPNRGLMLHLSHYDPVWFLKKDREKPFDLEIGLAAVDAMAEAGLNLLLIDVEDGVRLKSHPELRRHYSVPMRVLRQLAQRARAQGIEVVPKLNFSRSFWHHHNDWFRPHNAQHLFDSTKYWKTAFEVIDEVIAETQPAHYFHIGMDEDHDRACWQYVAAIKALRQGLKQRQLRTVLWNDTSMANKWPPAEVHAEKSRYAEGRIPKDIVQVIWDYTEVRRDVVRRVLKEGFEVWLAPAAKPRNVREARAAGEALGVQGLLLTRWLPAATPADRKDILTLIRTLGPLCG